MRSTGRWPYVSHSSPHSRDEITMPIDDIAMKISDVVSTLIPIELIRYGTKNGAATIDANCQ